MISILESLYIIYGFCPIFTVQGLWHKHYGECHSMQIKPIKTHLLLFLFIFQGDSGSPLMCLDSRGHWTLAGIMSSGPAGCGIVSTGADRFTKISAFIDWIANITTTTTTKKLK